MRKLVGFGRACAPVRCAHLSFWAHCHPKRDAARPPPCPSQLRCFSFDPQRYIKSIQLGPPTSKAFFTPLDHMHTAEAMKYEVPWPRPSQLRRSFPQYFGVKIMCRCNRTPEFFRFFLFYICLDIFFLLFCSFSSLLWNFFFFISSYILNCLRLLIFFSSYILNCLLCSRHEISVILRGFSRGPSLFWYIWGQN